MVFNWFKSSKEESSATQQPSWDANTMTMQQPSSPEAPSTERVVTQQPVRFLSSPYMYLILYGIKANDLFSAELPGRNEDGPAWWWCR